MIFTLPRMKTQHEVCYTLHCMLTALVQRKMLSGQDSILIHKKEQILPRFALAPLSIPSLSPITDIQTYNFFHQIKANLAWKQMWILFICAYCIKHCSVKVSMNFEIIISKYQFNIVLTLPHDPILVWFPKNQLSIQVDRSLIPRPFYSTTCVVYTHTYHTSTQRHTTFPLFTGLYINICSNVVRFENIKNHKHFQMTFQP